MAVFATNPSRLKASKRGYFNRFTGEILEAKYDKAWVFGDCGILLDANGNEVNK